MGRITSGNFAANRSGVQQTVGKGCRLLFAQWKRAAVRRLSNFQYRKGPRCVPEPTDTDHRSTKQIWKPLSGSHYRAVGIRMREEGRFKLMFEATAIFNGRRIPEPEVYDG
jgi:hypothetical protein